MLIDLREQLMAVLDEAAIAEKNLATD